MELKEFVKKVLVDLDEAIGEVNQDNKYEVSFSQNESKRTVEFDVAITTEESKTAKGKAGIKVLSFAQAGGDLANEKRNSTASRVTFGVNVSPMTREIVIENKEKQQSQMAMISSHGKRTFS